MLIEDLDKDGQDSKSDESSSMALDYVDPTTLKCHLCAVNSSQHLALKLFVGAGARLLFYPTLFYNVVRNKYEADFNWWDQIEPYLLLGAVPFPKDVYRLKNIGVGAVITLNESYETLVSASHYKNEMIEHLVIPTRDYLFAPSFDDIERAVDFINDNMERGVTTYVHCKAGRGRSTTVILCYLAKYRGMSPYEAFSYVRSKRPRVMLAAAQWKAVLSYSKYHKLGKASSAPHTLLLCQWPSCKSPHGGDGDESTCPNIDGDEAITSNQDDVGFCGEYPVLVTWSDLEGYDERDVCLKENELHGDPGLAYKVGSLTAKSLIGVAKTSATLARIPYAWMGHQTGNQAAFNMTLTCSSLSETTSQPSPLVSLHVCQQGLVEC